jgi:hypothetical protein
MTNINNLHGIHPAVYHIRIYDVYSKDSLHNNICERTTKLTLMCYHFVLFVAHATCFDPCFGSSSGA